MAYKYDNVKELQVDKVRDVLKKDLDNREKIKQQNLDKLK